MSEEDKIKQKRSDVEWVLSTEQGRRFVWDILGTCGVYRSLEGDSDSRSIQEGARRMGLHILGKIMDADEMLYVKMQLEARNSKIQEIANDNANDSSRTDTSSSSPDSEYDLITGGYDSGTPFEYDAFPNINEYI